MFDCKKKISKTCPVKMLERYISVFNIYEDSNCFSFRSQSVKFHTCTLKRASAPSYNRAKRYV